ncbi:hypothetical protein PUP68_11765 [Pseudomonas chlororaphis]|uniref:hypothetical protein n=1 Tax=Pseudomonas chlororaphis TaxID=587753 RepID=UPI002368689C|nr:hypothetical protein [Pseudomonas chlororaphis]WDG79199.1 hypothetical protein PUP77_00475 [Pseudomonas chlororaphis]WDG87749.1 hypothetical protein PUP68_11765 [Pseudomonas chlororaphis]
MPEVHRYKVVKMLSEDGNRISYDPNGPDVVRADDFDRVTAERDALQSDLDARDQRIDELEGLLRLARQFVVNGIDLGYITMPDPETPDPAHDMLPKIDAALSASAEPATGPSDEVWRMNPCKQGHADVGAAGGVASCYQCDEKITAATTEEAFALWNAGHPKACCGSCPAGCTVGAKP